MVKRRSKVKIDSGNEILDGNFNLKEDHIESGEPLTRNIKILVKDKGRKSGVDLDEMTVKATNVDTVHFDSKRGFLSLPVEVNNDTCGMCGIGGELLCCDTCTGAYHLACHGLKKLPIGDWSCKKCVDEFVRRDPTLVVVGMCLLSLIISI